MTGPGAWTVFAPNNYAFYTLMPNLVNVIWHHVVNEYWLTMDFPNPTGTMLMVNNQTVDINMSNYGGYTEGFAVEYGSITLMDQQHEYLLYIFGQYNITHIVHLINYDESGHGHSSWSFLI